MQYSRNGKFTIYLIYITFILLIAPLAMAATPTTNAGFADEPLLEPLVLPDWFKVSFLDMNEDLRDANRNNRGLIIYFGRHDCPYCKALLEKNWGQQDIVVYTRAHFDVVAIDVLGNRTVTDFASHELSEKAFAIASEAQFTPTLFMFDNRGKLALKLTGYRPPYQFRAALEFVADHHQSEGSFRDYLARAEPAYSYGQNSLNEYKLFHPPEFLHTYDRRKHNKPLLVVFERTRCHACDVLHAGPLDKAPIKRLISKLDAVQLDMWREQPVVTPSGEHLTEKAWADKLDLSYAPTLIFYDETGREIIRIDSVLGFYRLQGVLNFVTSRGYRQYPNYQQWRSHFGNRGPAS